MSFTKNQERYLKKKIQKILADVDPSRYSQEPQLQGVVFGKLDGFAYSGRNEVLVIKYTGVDDHGPGAAEKRTGADLAITVTRYPTGGDRVEKATLGQAKKGRADLLTPSEQGRLEDQIRAMSELTENPLVIELPTEHGQLPKVRITSPGQMGPPMGIDDYLVDHLISCNHGDRRKEFVASVQDSSLSQLEIFSSAKR